MIKVQRFINQLLSSNCFIVYDEETLSSLVIDPGSEKSENEIAFIESNHLQLDYILLTHEHADHTWGVNSLVEQYPNVKVVCSSLCRDNLPKEVRLFFQLYYDNPSKAYTLSRVDSTTEELNWHLDWVDHKITFIPAPGHTLGSICIAIETFIFGGDTLIQSKPFIRKRNGGSLKQYNESVECILKNYPEQTLVYPGHGDDFSLYEYVVPEENLKRKV